jgi:hypothetical protein
MRIHSVIIAWAAVPLAAAALALLPTATLGDTPPPLAPTVHTPAEARAALDALPPSAVLMYHGQRMTVAAIRGALVAEGRKSRARIALLPLKGTAWKRVPGTTLTLWAAGPKLGGIVAPSPTATLGTTVVNPGAGSSGTVTVGSSVAPTVYLPPTGQYAALIAQVCPQATLCEIADPVFHAPPYRDDPSPLPPNGDPGFFGVAALASQPCYTGKNYDGTPFGDRYLCPLTEAGAGHQALWTLAANQTFESADEIGCDRRVFAVKLDIQAQRVWLAIHVKAADASALCKVRIAVKQH